VGCLEAIDGKYAKVHYGFISTKNLPDFFFNLAKSTITCETTTMKKRSLITALALSLFACGHALAAEKTLRIGIEAAYPPVRIEDPGRHNRRVRL